jgi:hypothetical protein
MFLMNNGKSIVKFYKKNAQELITGNVSDKKSAILIANSKEMGTSKSILFKNTIGQTMMVAFAKSPNLVPDKIPGPDFSFVGAVFSSAGTITVTSADVAATISPALSGNSIGNWKPGASFRVRGTTSNNNKTFVITSVVGNVITVDTTLGSTPANESISNSFPVLFYQISLVDAFEIVDGDSISLDLHMNTMDISGETGSTDVYIYPVGVVTASTTNAFRIYSFAM